MTAIPAPSKTSRGIGIGCGVISESHLSMATACPGADVVAVADRHDERARAMAEKYGVSTHYDHVEDLLDDPRVEAVVLAVPTFERTPLALEALERGKHVLLEKPAAGSAPEIEKMMVLRGDRVVACCSSRMGFAGHAEAAARCAPRCGAP